jgi:serine/threonine protein kinase
MASNIKRTGNAAPEDPSAEFEVLEKIGQGSFGIIRKVRRKATGEILARKEISYAAMSQREKEQLHAEIRVLERLQHTHIVRYVSRHHVKASNELHLYMEYCSSGDLGGYIKRLARTNSYADEVCFLQSCFVNPYNTNHCLGIRMANLQPACERSLPLPLRSRSTTPRTRIRTQSA